MGQTTDRNRARLPLLFGMKFTPANTSANRGQFAEQTMLTNNSVALCLIMVQRDGEKRSWITSGGHTLISNDWHPAIWSVGSRQLLPKLPLATWRSIYIFMKKNEFKLLYTNYVKDM
jgi:hypothetical protein